MNIDEYMIMTVGDIVNLGSKQGLYVCSMKEAVTLINSKKQTCMK